MKINQPYIPFGRPNFSEKEIRAVSEVIKSGWIGMGPETIAFESELADYLGAKEIVTVNSCTSALFLAMLSHRIGEGDEVICPSLTWCSTANCILYVGAKPVFCDVDPTSFCLTPASVLSHVTERTKAVIVVHYGGYAMDVTALRSALPPHIAIIEDAAHALGAKYKNGRPVGSSGNITCFSFYANKNLSTGEGGALAVPSKKIAEHLRSLRLHGYPSDAWQRYLTPLKIKKFNGPTELGYKLNYSDLQASIGRVQLRRQPELKIRRLSIAKFYAQELKRISPNILMQENILSSTHARHLFVISIPLERMTLSREAVILSLRKKGIGAAIHYQPLHKMKIYGKQSKLIVTERLAERIITLPFSASMSTGDAKKVINCFEFIFTRHLK